ncbi:hypothetical protein EXN51_27825 [Agrobacterium fabrum]|uniref:Uncharacterized protein n=1 Tax=Agrobacterium fabrum (strain C58 / ATCC 33970) TaxID=176299 RepID=Q8U524_AGRFC|nr:hypothetical protein Atu4887 [Agrobacterium fabrum str. C58]TRB20829.1 hypothetical protein EXN51_27825 [Agrobacterium fabrum]
MRARATGRRAKTIHRYGQGRAPPRPRSTLLERLCPSSAIQPQKLRNVALLYLPQDMIGVFGNLVLILPWRQIIGNRHGSPCQDRQEASRQEPVPASGVKRIIEGEKGNAALGVSVG